MAQQRDGTNGERIRTSEQPVYRLAATGRQEDEDERLSLLEAIFDPLSRQRRAFVQPRWRCFEVGAGRGSMAVWFAQQVGANGRVVATDVDTPTSSGLTSRILKSAGMTSSVIHWTGSAPEHST